jgi:hypothetical protein
MLLFYAGQGRLYRGACSKAVDGDALCPLVFLADIGVDGRVMVAAPGSGGIIPGPLRVHPKVVSELLGHATIALTLDTYSHVIPSLHEEAAG